MNNKDGGTFVKLRYALAASVNINYWIRAMEKPSKSGVHFICDAQNPIEPDWWNSEILEGIKPEMSESHKDVTRNNTVDFGYTVPLGTRSISPLYPNVPYNWRKLRTFWTNGPEKSSLISESPLYPITAGHVMEYITVFHNATFHSPHL